MKKIITLIAGLVLMISPVYAEEVDSYFSTDTEAKEINHSYFKAGQNITTEDTVKGLYFIAGESVKDKSTAEYKFIAAENIELGSTTNDAFIAGQTITMEKEEVIGRDLYIVGETITLKGTINGNLFVAAQTLNLEDATINGSVNAYVETLTTNESTLINDKLTINEEATKTLSSQITNVETYQSQDAQANMVNTIKSKISNILAALLIGAILLYLLPNMVKTMNKNSKEALNWAWKGLGLLICTPFIAIVCLMTTITIPLALILLALYMIGIYVSIILAGMYVGKLMNDKWFKVKSNYMILIGVLLVKLLTLIPVVGTLVEALSILIGFGYIQEQFRIARTGK